MVKKFRQGDIIYMDFDPQTGHEQSGRRPAVVVSNDLFNRFCTLTLVCPITRTDRQYALHVPLDDRTETEGFIMCDQVRALDLNSRNAEKIEKLPWDIIAETVDMITGFVEMPEEDS